MSRAKQIMKNLLISFSKSPLRTLSSVGHTFLYSFKAPAQVGRLREIIRQTPLLLQVETTNVCNSACIFCAYRSMKRKKGVMDMELFNKIAAEYAAMGGGPVSLTPIMGDALLDPHLLDRLRVLQSYPEINQITLTTNAIALNRYSDEDVVKLLSTLYCMQISIGGLNEENYKTMYGVNQFSRVKQAIDRIIRVKDTLPQPANITLAFRTNDWRFESRFKKQIDAYKNKGVYVSHISMFMNYAGAVCDDATKVLVIAENPSRKCRTCVSVGLSLAICQDGKITACGCADFEGDKLTIGHAENENIAKVWTGEKRLAILESFRKGTLYPICRQCSAYTPDTVYASSWFQGVQPHQPLPLDFFHNMMT